MARAPRVLSAALAGAAVLVLLVTATREGRRAGSPAGPPEPPAAPKRAVRADAGWGDVAGRVSDLDGRPVEGALVLAQNLTGLAGAARTAPDGTYVLSLMPWDRVRPRWPDRGFGRAEVPLREAEVLVAARAAGFSRSTTRRILARRSERTGVGPVVLYRGGWVEGRVADEGGREVAARVRVAAVDSRDLVEGMQGLPPAWPEEAVPFGPGGTFRIGPLGPGEAVLFAVAPGVGAGSATVLVEEGRTSTVAVTVRALPSIAGRVVDREGRGVAGIRVTCVPEAEPEDVRTPKVRTRKPSGPETLLSGALATDTAGDGSFALHGVRVDANYTVAAGGAGGPALRGVTAGRTDLVLALPPRARLTGTVREAAGARPLPGAAVRVLPGVQAALLRLTHPLGLEGVGTGLPTSGADGAFAVPGLFPGEYRLVVSLPGFEIAEVAVSVPAEGGDPAPVEVRLAPAAALVVLVRDGRGEPAAGAEACVAVAPPCDPQPASRAGPWSGRLHAATAADGTCRIEGLPAGVPLVLRVRGAEGRSARRDLVLAPGERREEAVLLAEPAALALRVQPATSGASGGHPIRLVGLDDPEVEAFAETDEEGLARVTHLPPGRYRVLATDPREDPSRPGVADRIVEIDLSAGIEAESRFTIPDVTLVRGRVAVGDTPLADGRVGFGPLEGTPDHFRPLLFRVRAGVYEGLVPPGRYHVSVEFPGRRIEVGEPVRVPAAPTHALDWSFPAD